MLFIAAFAFINILNLSKKYTAPDFPKKAYHTFFQIAIPGILIIVIYTAFRMEIAAYFNQIYHDSLTSFQKTFSASGQQPNEDVLKFKSIWLINYSLFFFTVLSFVNIKKIRNASLGLVNLLLSTLVLLYFMGEGLYTLGELRDSYLNQSLTSAYQSSAFNIGLRYISYVFVAFMILSIYRSIKQNFMKESGLKLNIAFDGLLYISIVWIGSSELINCMDIMHSSQSYKLGLSILWGVYALLMIILGIWKKKKHIRIGAIVLFALTLLKLFAYDISDMDTISKTIVFVLLGLLLLVISFLYNKYRYLMKEEEG
jgi:uncharacterized membrane protein